MSENASCSQAAFSHLCIPLVQEIDYEMRLETIKQAPTLIISIVMT